MEIKFPKNFKFGAATSAFQIEGAIKEDGRGELYWDRILKPPLFNFDINIGADHYHRYNEDVQLMKKIGLESYRFSISWVRICPEGKTRINEKGIGFYDNLISELIKNGIDPLATLNHFDVPYSFYEKGGWLNEELINSFTYYAKTCFEHFGDQVNFWATFNEPWVDQFMIPFIIKQPTYKRSKKMFAECLNGLHNLFRAHAKAIETYHEMSYKGKIGIVLNLAPAYPLTDSEEDKEAAKRFDDLLNKWHLSLSLNGKYPQDMFDFYQDAVGAPVITDEDMELIKKSKSDFLGVNFYGPFIIQAAREFFPINGKIYQGERSREWANNAKIVPEALYKLLIRIHKDFSPTIYITENGCSFGDEQLNDEKDEWRIDYLKKHLIEVKRAIDDGVKVEGYYVWSLMDNLEWAQGYKERYGLIYVDHEHDLKRTIKKSGLWYSEVIKNLGFNI